MTPALPRVWLVAAAVTIGTAHGCAPDPLGFSAMPVVAVLGAVAAVRRPAALRAAGTAALALALASVGAAPRCEAATALGAIARTVPMCAFNGTILELAGGLGTLVQIDRIECDGYVAAESPGVAVLDGVVGDAGGGIEGRGRLVPLGTDEFDRARARVGAHAYLDVLEARTKPPRGPHAVAAAVRQGLVSSTRRVEVRRAGLLRGLAIGDVAAIDEETELALRRAGLSHLLAVSGSNVAIVLGAVAAATSAFGARLRTGAALAALGFYVLVVGPDPSVLRAAAMGGIGVAALALGSRAEPLHALGLALIVLVALRPGLVFAVGLHLSVAATGGIVVWAPLLARRFAHRLPRVAALGVAATVAAQAAVAPILVGVFGELSIAGPVANALALPAVPPATVCSLAAGVAGLLHAPTGAVLAHVAEPFAAWILWVGDLFGGAEWAAVTLPSWTGLPAGVAAAIGAGAALRRR